MRRQIDNDVLEMALLGYRARREEVIRKMAEIEALLRGRGVSATGAKTQMPAVPAKPKRQLSEAGRQAIRAGVKKRWAEFRAKARSLKVAKKKPAASKRTEPQSA